MERGLIRYAEQRAADLGITYRHDTPPEELLAEIGRRERQAIADIPSEQFPSGCYGKYWAGYWDHDCQVCQVQAACLARFATDTLAEAEAKLGHKNPYQLSPILSGEGPEDPKVPPSAIALAQVFAEDLAGRAPPHEPYPYRLIPGRRRPVPDVSRHRPPQRPWSATSFACVIAAQATKAPWPPPIPGVSERLNLHISSLYVRLRKAPWDRFAKPPFGSALWQKRFNLERTRTPIIGHLCEGSVLRRMYQGELVEVYAQHGHYTWRGYRYPTLYEAVCGIVGTKEHTRPKNEGSRHGTRRMGDYSARRFFYKAFAELEARTGMSAATRKVAKRAVPQELSGRAIKKASAQKNTVKAAPKR